MVLAARLYIAMAPQKCNREIVFNSMVNNEYGATVLDVMSREIVRKYFTPIYSISNSGGFAVSLNFSRLGRLRPGYGYSLIKDKTIGINAPPKRWAISCRFEHKC